MNFHFPFIVIIRSDMILLQILDKEKDIETVSINQSICETHLVPQQNKDQVFKSSRIQVYMCLKYTYSLRMCT